MSVTFLVEFIVNSSTDMIKASAACNSSRLCAQLLCTGSGWFPHAPGGTERYVYELLQHLSSTLDAIELCGVGVPTSAPDFPVQLTNLANPDSPLWTRLWSVRQRFRQRQIIQPDAINLHFALYGLPILQDLPRDIPVTFTFHGPWALESQQEGANHWSVAGKTWIERYVYERCDRFIVLSKAFGTILHHAYKVPWHKIYVIPGGVDTNRFQIDRSRKQARQQLGWQSDRFILFTPRRLVQRMGLNVLLNALTQVRLECPDIWLAIAGKGSQRQALERQVSDLGLENHVKFLGFVPDDHLPLAYQAADLTVMPSQSLEGFGLVLLESLACGTPILCTPIGGMPEVLTHFTPELITDAADEVAIANRLTAILRGDLSLPSRESCRKYVMTHFDWAKIAQQVQQVLLAPKV